MIGKVITEMVFDAGPEENLQIAGHVGRTQVYFFWPDELRRK